VRHHDLDSWLAWQETLHPSAIDLGLERVREVLGRMGLATPPFRVAVVGGTNGKGSTVALLEGLARRAGLTTAAYTSPHLVRYTERLRIDGDEVQPADFVEAFESVDQARAGTSLTYFEFGTLAAFEICRRRSVEFAVLEVGMGGRLDAVNVFEPEVAIVTRVGLDHTEWLGPDRESIGREKGGIFRPGRPAVIGDRNAPGSLMSAAGADRVLIGRDFDRELTGVTWSWHGAARRLDGLPAGVFAAPALLDNAACALAAFSTLPEGRLMDRDFVAGAIRDIRLPGRLQRVPGEVEWWLDVAHNPDGAAMLASALQAAPAAGRTLAVVGMLSDKDVEGVARALDPWVDAWFAAGLAPPRGLEATVLAGRLAAHTRGTVEAVQDVVLACRRAREAASRGDRIVVMGSFHAVGPALVHLGLYCGAAAGQS
jgi:dihydrofolate synthase/folylpolyglutamate synthase